MPTENKPAASVTAAEELDAVLHWRGKHAQAIKERDALQLRLNTADQRIDELVELLRDAGCAVNQHAMTAWAIPLSKKIAAALNHTESRAGESCHEIPGTSRMRLNMLANQGE
jgi:hypothetical protein